MLRSLAMSRISTMENIHRDDLMKLARRLDAVTDNVRRVHNEIGLPLSLAQALTSLERAEALILETANS
jgi:hypothetical protein